MKMRLLALAFFWCGAALFAQEYFPKNDGVKSKDNNYTAFTNAKIYVTPTQIINGGTLLIQHGKVVQAGKSIPIPKNTITVDLTGKSVYPSFIDMYSGFGVPLPKKAESNGRSAEYDTKREGFYWNDHIMPENDAVYTFKYNDEKAKELREIGFGVVNTHIKDGIASGTGVLVTLNAQGNDANRILDDRSGNHFSFNKSIASNQAYPTSLMGSMALLRQMYYDADWYAKGNVDTEDRSLEALNRNKEMLQIFEAGDKGDVVRADGIGDKFEIQFTIVGGGDEYERIADVKATNAPMILPLNFPDAYDVSDPYAAGYVSLADMRNWNQSPANPKILAENDITFSLTLHKLKKVGDFNKKIMKAIAHGLSKTKALEALTIVPAQMLGKSAEIGSLEPGRYANFLITSGDIFDTDTTLYENWVQGHKNTITDMSLKDIRGEYDLSAGGQTFKLSISGEPGKPKVEVKKDTATLKSKFSYSSNWFQLSFADATKKNYRMTGLVTNDSDDLSGKGALSNGDEGKFTAKKTSPFSKKVKKETPDIQTAGSGGGHLSKYRLRIRRDSQS